MMKPAELPLKTKLESPFEGSRYTHPAFAQISASRGTGGDVNLYGSDFKHSSRISIRINASQLDRHLSRDWVHARKPYIEVELSEAQWATFVSSMNMGDGVPCTLRYKDGEMIAPIADNPAKKEQFSQEFMKIFEDKRRHVKAIIETVNNLKLSDKAKRELLFTLNNLHDGLRNSPEFVAESFGEYMEDVTETAKIEVNAYITTSVQRAGLEALGAPIQLQITNEDK